MKKKRSTARRDSGNIRMADDAAVQDDGNRAIVLHRAPVGSAGTQSNAGYPSEDYLAEMRGRARADVFDKMRRSDTQVKMCLSAVKNPIKAGNWEIEPADDSPEAKADAELVEHILLKDMSEPFTQFIAEALTIADFGHAVFEVTDKVVLDHPKFGSYNGIRSLGFRSQRTIERWNLDKDTGKLASVSQYAYGDLQRLVDIPAEFLLAMSIDREGANYEGISLLRACYGSFFRKNIYLKMNAIGIEKFAVPTPIAKIPEGKQNTEQYANLIEALEIYTTHQANYLTIPAGWEVTLQQNAYDPEKVETSIDREDLRMAKAFLANFLELGTGGSGGAFALSADLSDFFLGGVKYVAGEIAGPVDLQLIPRIVMLNRGPRAAYPRLKCTGIDDRAGKEFGELMKAMSDARYITPDEPLEEHFRKRLGLPKKSATGSRPGGATPAPAAPAPAGVPAPGQVTDQKTALTGVQVESMLEVIARVGNKQIPRPTGIELLVAAFNISAEAAEKIMGEVGKTFAPTAPPAPGPGMGAPSSALAERIRMADMRRRAAGG